LAEKPIALKIEEGVRMADVAEKCGRILMGAYMKRYDLGTEYVKKFIIDDTIKMKLGQIKYARFHNFNGAFGGQLIPRNYIADVDRKDYTEVGDLRIPDFVRKEDEKRYFCSFINFSHDINLMRYLLGEPKTVYASHHRVGPSDYHTFSTTIFEYPDFTTTLETGCVECDYFDEFAQIYFERGWIEQRFSRVHLQNVPAKVTIFDNKAGFMTPTLGWGWSFQRQADHFIECILKKHEPISNGADSIKDIAIGQAWYRSYLEQKRIIIE